MTISRRAGGAAATLSMLLLVLTGCGNSEPATAPDRPAEGNVLDSADVLTTAEEQSLNALIEERNISTDGARVAVLTVENAGGSIEDYARSVANEWEVGDAGADNGVLVVADTAERELRIETADGVRQQFSDDEAAVVIEDVLEPAFADEQYAEGLTEAVEQIYLHADGQEPVQEPFNWALLAWVVGGITALLGIIISAITVDSRRHRRVADAEIREAEEKDPTFRLTEEQRKAYRKYRYSNRGDDAVNYPPTWLPLYIANPALYSGASTGTQAGSSFGGGGGFTGGGASGKY
ncbi:TPM domain-containing protein [Arthrobacter sp. 260]|uniref:TPM domain-containing protein n=1 Tax=Arthrobacter sp. 260 TaxID=2735314 RepID=UPI00149279A1|nr:TPM domain-containing protein [Arthrobacter sp. 260]NOJ58928.1 TPM domain-containing protein [Arthrobacter sp. 260]